MNVRGKAVGDGKGTTPLCSQHAHKKQIRQNDGVGKMAQINGLEEGVCEKTNTTERAKVKSTMLCCVGRNTSRGGATGVGKEEGSRTTGHEVSRKIIARMVTWRTT